jgi:hypothetical protein
VVSSPASPLEVFGGVFGTVLGGFASAGIVIVLVVFFLIRREDLRDRFIHLIGKDQVTVTTQMLEDAGTRVSRYLSMLLFINATFGTAVGIGLYLIGLPNAVLWGILAATLRFIPYLGPWIAAAMPIGLAMAISTGWLAPLLTIGLFVVLELFSNNVMEPWLYGKRTGVSAVAVLVAAVFWTWLWGVVGLLLATPLTVCLLVIGKHVPQLSFLDVLLGNEPVFEPAKRVYQRLVAGDQEEAAELVEDYCLNTPVVEVYDTMLISALASSETHWRRGDFGEDRHKYILQSVKEIVQEQGERRQETGDRRQREPERGRRGFQSRGCGRSGGALRSVPARAQRGGWNRRNDAVASGGAAGLPRRGRPGGVLGQRVDRSGPAAQTPSDLHFRHASRRHDACSRLVQASSWSSSGRKSGGGIVARTRRSGQGERAHRLWPEHSRGCDVGGSSRSRSAC